MEKKRLLLGCVLLLLVALGACTKNPEPNAPTTPSAPVENAGSPDCSHVFSEWIVDVSATCDKTGSQHRICAHCDRVEITAVPMLAHTEVIIPGTPATETTAGMSDGSLRGLPCLGSYSVDQRVRH